MTDSPRSIAPAAGKLGVLLPGMGAVASTFIAGVVAAREGLQPPIGSISQMAHIRLGSREEGRNPLIRDFVPLAGLDDLVFGGWDPISPNAMEAARTAGVLDDRDLTTIASELEGIVPMDAVFDQEWVSKLDGVRVKDLANKWDQAEALIADIARFREENDCDRMVMVWCGSTEAYSEPSEVHETVAAFEEGLKNNDPNIAPSQIYAYAALQSDVPFANGAPNLTVDIPCMIELAHARGVPVAGKDFKTGQTLMKTLISARTQGPHARRARLVLDQHPRQPRRRGSRRPGELPDEGSLEARRARHDPAARRSTRDLYGDIDHKVRIDYYPPRGDDKEGWDNIDIFGWLGYPMQIKINFLCRDSILAAPRSCSTWRCSWTSRTAPASPACRSG